MSNKKKTREGLISDIRDLLCDPENGLGLSEKKVDDFEKKHEGDSDDVLSTIFSILQLACSPAGMQLGRYDLNELFSPIGDSNDDKDEKKTDAMSNKDDDWWLEYLKKDQLFFLMILEIGRKFLDASEEDRLAMMRIMKEQLNRMTPQQIQIFVMLNDIHSNLDKRLRKSLTNKEDVADCMYSIQNACTTMQNEFSKNKDTIDNEMKNMINMNKCMQFITNSVITRRNNPTPKPTLDDNSKKQHGDGSIDIRKRLEEYDNLNDPLEIDREIKEFLIKASNLRKQYGANLMIEVYLRLAELMSNKLIYINNIENQFIDVQSDGRLFNLKPSPLPKGTIGNN